MTFAFARLPLPLLKARIFLVNYIQLPFPPHDLAISAALFNGCTNFHNNDYYYLYLNIILPLVKSYGLISTPTLSPGKILM